jgi:hypothetical protein
MMMDPRTMEDVISFVSSFLINHNTLPPVPTANDKNSSAFSNARTTSRIPSQHFRSKMTPELASENELAHLWKQSL